MKRLFIAIASVLISLYGYCQGRYMNAYSKFIPKKYANKTGTLDVLSPSGNLVLFIGNHSFEILPEQWTRDDKTITIIRNRKKTVVKKDELEKYDYLLINEREGKYTITVRGEDFIDIYASGSKRANDLFKLYSSPSHSAHSSHMSHYSSSK